MRSFITGIVSVALVAFAASSAQATVSSSHFFEDSNGDGTPGTQVGGGISDLEIGDEFEVTISLSQASGDGFQSVFTYLVYNPSVLELVGGFTDSGALPGEGSPTPIAQRNTVAILGSPEPAVGQPAGTGIGLAIGITNPTTGNFQYNVVLNQASVAFAIFRVVGLGTSSIAQVDTGFSDIRVGGPIAFSAPLDVTTIPEPGTALLMGLGLAGLASAGRPRA